MKNKRLFAALSAGMLLLTACGTQTAESSETAETAPAETTAPAPPEKSLVTIGDSISAGYGLETPETERYSALLREKLEARDGITWNDYNYAVSGDDSSDLLHRLDTGKALRLPSSDTIIMCIGANNLLGVYTDYAKEKMKSFDVDLGSITEEDISAIREQLETETADQDALQADFQARIDEKLVTLEADLETAYEWIRSRNADADFYVLNVYNPYTPDSNNGFLQDSGAFYEFEVSNLERLNTIIQTFAESHDDLIFVDVAAAFAEYDTPPVIGSTAYQSSGEHAESFEFYDPHPTAEGQKCIADAVWQVMESRT